MLEGRILKYLNVIKHVYIDNSSSQLNITLSKSEHDSILELVGDVNYQVYGIIEAQWDSDRRERSSANILRTVYAFCVNRTIIIEIMDRDLLTESMNGNGMKIMIG